MSSAPNEETGEGARIGGISPDVRPLSEMLANDRYKGEDGGLYGQGRNAPPKEHLEAALREAKAIRPLDKNGDPSADGKIGFFSMGMSNTTQEFRMFLEVIRSVRLPPRLVVVDGAQNGQGAVPWATEPKIPNSGLMAWEELAKRLAANGVSPFQAQVVWLKLADGNPAKDGEFPGYARKFKECAIGILQKIKSRYPNVRLVYVSNRIYAGYATKLINPEPYAYEYAYAWRWIILDQIAGTPELNYDPAKGSVKAPLVLWGPDLWANGLTARKDGLCYARGDLGEDGTHPSVAGREKVAKLLLKFLQTDPTAKIWFVGE
ncbi:MAG: hypothetical protein NTW86_14850 [Candidatus Sumerlaeota bacterium]|nr:hypothetical protein [Candidatus Sumerlaeota bacterium]